MTIQPHGPDVARHKIARDWLRVFGLTSECSETEIALESNDFGDGASCGSGSGVAGCFLGESHAGGEAEFGVDVGEMGLHGAW